MGVPPQGALRTALEKVGVAVRASGGDDVALVVVQGKGTSLPPPAPDGKPWIWIAAREPGEQARTEAALLGAYDVIAADDAAAPKRLVERVRELLVDEPAPAPPPEIVAESDAAKRVLAQVARAARTHQPVLVTGETGTGKEQTARLVHTWSPRASKRFVPINCAAIPNELMEGELFGYAKGAFSGAIHSYDGALMAAAGGTVFLDEIDDTPMPTQVKLLRVLEDRVVTRLGESTPHQVDFRIVAATNENLPDLIERGRFGADLYERLAILEIHLPPLRQRPEDVPALVTHLIARFHREEPSARGTQAVTDVDPAALRALIAYPWPGNVRELRNALYEALVYKRAGTRLLLSDLPRRVLKREAGSRGAAPGVDRDRIAQRMRDGAFNLRDEVDAMEREALAVALERSAGNATAAAKLLGEVGRGRSQDPGGTVRAMMRRLGVSAKR